MPFAYVNSHAALVKRLYHPLNITLDYGASRSSSPRPSALVDDPDDVGIPSTRHVKAHETLIQEVP